MLLTRDQFLARLGYTPEKMSEKQRTRTAGRIAFKNGLAQVSIPGVKGFRYKLAQVDKLIEKNTAVAKHAA